MSAHTLPTNIKFDHTLRVKVGDACGLKCRFCHNEGTPVAIDNLGRTAGEYVGSGPSGRVSIYAESNNAPFLPGVVPWDERFTGAISALRGVLDFTEIHFTGGEPTLHPGIAELTRLAATRGFVVAMTSNGENGAKTIPDCAEMGLNRVNFSVFGTTGHELAQVQHEQLRDPVRAAKKIIALKKSIDACVANGVGASANIVVPDYSHAPRVHRLLDGYNPRMTIRLLNSLDRGEESVKAIEAILDERGAVPETVIHTAGASGSRVAYRMPDGRTIYFKQIRNNVRLPRTCASCPFNNGRDCHEGFYGIRLYWGRDGGFQVGVCIQRMDLCLPLEEFVRSSYVEEIRRLRAAEWVRLTAEQAR